MTDVALIGPVAPPELHVMTFNIRRRVPRSRQAGPDNWSTRRRLVGRLLSLEQPTLLGEECLRRLRLASAEAGGQS